LVSVFITTLEQQVKTSPARGLREVTSNGIAHTVLLCND
jgi:hypothetical protein